MDLYDENIARLIRHSLTGELSEQERGELEAWLHDSEEHRVLFEKIKKEIRISSESSLFRSLNDEVAWLKFKTTARERKRRVYVRRMLTYAAVIVLPLAVVAGFWFLSQEKDTFPMASERVVKITPGRPRAVLITADQTVHELNGVQEQREIEVEKGVMIKQGGANLEYDSLVAPEQEVALAMNTLKVPRGGEFRLKLSDGTNVYLNSASDLKYPVRFNEKERTVYLSGEAYFEVEKDSTCHFIVKAGEMEVEALGTAFNVRAYEEDKKLTATLFEGKVRTAVGKDEVILRPDESLSFDKVSRKMQVSKDIAAYARMWKDNELFFKGETLQEVAVMLDRLYNVQVRFASEKVKHYRFSGVIKNNSLENVIELISLTAPITYKKVEGDIVIDERK